MNPKLMIWASVMLSAVAQIALKQGLNRVRDGGVGKTTYAIAAAVASELYVWLWLFSFVGATGLWLLGLQKLELSYAYPLVSVGYLLVNLLSATLLHERVDQNRWIGVGIIGLGVAVIAGS